MKKQETLSDKEVGVILESPGSIDGTKYHKAILTQDVREFIRRLKNLLLEGDYYGDKSFTKLFIEIDKLAGEKFKEGSWV